MSEGLKFFMFDADRNAVCGFVHNDLKAAISYADGTLFQVINGRGEVVWPEPEPKYRLEWWEAGRFRESTSQSQQKWFYADEIDDLYQYAQECGDLSKKHGRIVRQSDNKVVKEWQTKPLRTWLEEGVFPPDYIDGWDEKAPTLDGNTWQCLWYTMDEYEKGIAALRVGDKIVWTADRDVTVVTVDETGGER